MPELEIFRHPRLDHVACTEKLYTLLVIFLASKHIGHLCELALNGNGGIFRQVLDQHAMSLATHLLIECAVLIRMKDDVVQELHGILAETEIDIVGTLFTGYMVRGRRLSWLGISGSRAAWC